MRVVLWVLCVLVSGASCQRQTLVACSADRSCAANMHCVAAAADAAAYCAPGPRCAANSDCPGTLPRCSSGVCINACLQTPAPVCPSGQTCVFMADGVAPPTCAGVEGCGDGVRAAPEACDGTDLGGLTCASIGLGKGALRCTPGCNLDVSACSIAYATPASCGDGKLQESEACEGGILQPALTCAVYGYDAGGALQCNRGTCQADTRGCEACGDGIRQSSELCDGTTLSAGATCATQGFDAGALRCNRACNGYDTRGCQRCGNGVLEGSEVCDGAAFHDTCVNAGFRAGTLVCHSDCKGYDAGECTDWYPLGTSNTLLGVSANLASNGNGAGWPVMQFLGDGTPLIVWRDRRGNTCTAAHVYTNGAWGPLAASITPNVQGDSCLQNHGRPAAAYSAQEDSVYVAWSAPLQNGNVFVAYSGSVGWSTAGDANNAADGITGGLGGDSSYPAIAVSPGQGHQTVAVWQQDVQGRPRVYGRVLQGGQWTDLSGGGSSGDGIGTGIPPPSSGELALPQVAVDSNNTTFVAWVGDTNDLRPTLFARSLSNGASTWSDLPAIPFPSATQTSRQPVLRLDGAGTLWIAWTNSTGEPYGQILVAQYRQGRWLDAAGGTDKFAAQPTFLSTASSPSLTFDPSNAPVVAFEDDAQVYADSNTVDDTRQIYVRRFNGNTWVGIDGSDTGHGVSRSDRLALRPSVAWLQSAGGDNNVCVAWEHVVSNSSLHQIRALCHAM